MEVRREFKRDNIEVCRHCKNEGTITVADFTQDGSYAGNHKETCPTCGGSGLVRKRITGVVTVEPYEKKTP